MSATIAIASGVAPTSTHPPARASRPHVRAVDRLQGVQVDAESGLHIGTVVLGEQSLRVGIRPVAAADAAGPPMLFFNGIGANLELAGPLMSKLDQVETVIFDVPG